MIGKKTAYIALLAALFFPASLALASGSCLNINHGTAGDGEGWGNPGARYEAIPFTPVADCTPATVTFTAGYYNSYPGGSPTMEIYDDNSGVPGSSLVAAAYAVTGSSLANYTATFSSTITLTGGTQYWIVYKTDLFDCCNFYHTGAGLSGTEHMWYWDGAAWNDRGIDPVDMLSIDEAGGGGGGGGTSTLAEELAAADAGFASTTGFHIAGVITWSGDHILKVWIGSGIGLLYELRFWLIAAAIIGAIIAFSMRGFKFFKH